MRISDWSSDVCSSDLWRWREPLTCWRRESRLPRKTISPYVIRTKGDELNLGKCRRDHHDEIRIRLAHRHKPASRCIQKLPCLTAAEIGRASGRERVCPYVSNPLVAGSIKKERKI